jgi:uncharacterized protein (TIGR03437 family)
LPDGTYTGTVKIGGQPFVAATEVPVTIMIGDPGPQLPLSGIVNSASLQGDAIAPGEIVTLSGSELGPHIPYSAQIWDGVVAAKIAGTRVWFDDTPAPLLYALPNQVLAVVPNDVTGKKSVQVRVENMVIRSLPITVPVQESAPALFTANYSGKGPVTALNQNSVANSGLNLASKGSIVTLYATGAGAMDPPLLDGTIVSSQAASRPVLPVSVTIDGQPAEVLYTRALSQTVPGLLQINVRIPPNAGSGTVSVVLTVGGFHSPDGCTIFIR